MISIFVRYTTLLTLTLFALIALSFTLIYLFPADPIVNLTGIIPQNDMQRAALIRAFRLEDGYVAQFWYYLNQLATGNWGYSLSSGRPLLDEVLTALPATIELSTYAMTIVIGVGIPIGCISGLRAYSRTDLGINSASVMIYSVPVFWMALILILAFSLHLGWLPLSGRLNLLFDVPKQTGFLFIDILLAKNLDTGLALHDAFLHLILPTMSIALISTSALIRITRRSIIDVLNQPYITAAKSRGLSVRQIFLRHVLRNALLPILPLLAMQITALITNAIIVETLFSWPGIGNWLIQAIYQRDYSALRVGMLAVSTLVVIITISIDLFTRLIDPSREKFENVPI